MLDKVGINFVDDYLLQQKLLKVSLLAGAMASMGVKKGDKVLIYMPLIPEAAIAMLATARLGAVHSVVFGGKTKHSRGVQC